MAYIFQPYTVLLFTAAALAAAMAISAIKMRPNLGTRSFALLMSAVTFWAIVAVFEVISLDQFTKIFSHSFKYLFIVIVPITWLTFGLYYANRLRRWQRLHLILLMIIPVVTLALIVTNDRHELMFTSLEWHHGNNGLLIFRNFGPWFWVHTAYSYIMLATGFFYLVKSLIDSPTPYRRQLLTLLVGGLTPWVCNMLFIFKGRPFPFLDLTPFAFSISGLAFLWGIMRYRLLDLVPVARDIVIQNLQDGIIVVDETQRILDINPVGALLVAKPADELIGMQADRVVPWWHGLNTISANNTGKLPAFKIELDDDVKWVRAMKTPLSHNGRSLGHLVLLADITAIKKAEDALRLSEDRFKSLTENAPILIFSLNEPGDITYVNPAWNVILGYKRKDIIGQPFDRYVADNHKSPHRELFEDLIKGNKHFVETDLELLHLDGRKHIFALTAAVNSDTEARITGIIGLAKDVTEEKQLQEQLFMSQKMEAIGTLAGGIAHDFNNLLMGIQANISLMRLEAGKDSPVQEKLNRVENQIQSGSSLTRQLLGYARKGKYTVHAIDIRSLIEDTLHVVRRTNKQIQIHQDLSNEPLMMEADRGQIELVLLNLFVNALDAMPNGGTLSLLTRMVDAKDMNGKWPDLKPGCYIKIEIADTGVGMDEHTKDRMFEPFFTTKEIGRGTGLGLASVYGVVKNHEGHIQADSVAGHGTTFKILFPTAGSLVSSDNAPEACRESDIPLSNGGTILLVDDEPSILEFCGEMIESLGHKVLKADGGNAALKIYRKRHFEIDLVILDMIMPIMDGIATYHALKSINPRIRVIIASGYGLNEGAKEILNEGPHCNLKKTFHP